MNERLNWKTFCFSFFKDALGTCVLFEEGPHKGMVFHIKQDPTASASPTTILHLFQMQYYFHIWQYPKELLVKSQNVWFFSVFNMNVHLGWGQLTMEESPGQSGLLWSSCRFFQSFELCLGSLSCCSMNHPPQRYKSEGVSKERSSTSSQSECSQISAGVCQSMQNTPTHEYSHHCVGLINYDIILAPVLKLVFISK